MPNNFLQLTLLAMPLLWLQNEAGGDFPTKFHPNPSDSERDQSGRTNRVHSGVRSAWPGGEVQREGEEGRGRHSVRPKGLVYNFWFGTSYYYNIR
jgi:hypothetical protein